MMPLNTYTDRDSLRQALCERISSELTTAIARRGLAWMAVSGGNTPLPLFKQLSQLQLPWDKVHITLADERLVPNDHPRSNEKLVRDTLLQGQAASARFSPLQDLGDRSLDLVLLGMGTDGHTASLFPDAAELEQALSTEASICELRPASQPEARLSLTPAAFRAAGALILHIESQEKKQVLEAAQQPGAITELPVRVLLAPNLPLTIYWAN